MNDSRIPITRSFFKGISSRLLGVRVNRSSNQVTGNNEMGWLRSRPFLSSKISHLQSEAKSEVIFYYDADKTHIHNKGFALSLVLKVRFFGTRKWPVQLSYTPHFKTSKR